MAVELRKDFIRVARDWKDYGEKKISKSGASIVVIDTEDPLYEVLNNPNRLGIASRIMTFKPGYVIAKGLDNYSLKPFYEKPVFISGFDVT